MARYARVIINHKNNGATYMRALAKDLTVKSGKVELAGWVNSRRDHGGLIFIDLRDHTGIIQLVVDPNTADAFKLAESLRDEFVIRATGTVRKRGEGLENPNIPTGNIEVVVESMELLNRSEALPVSTHDEGTLAGEELRLKYRYLDLRRPSMQARLARRSEYYRIMRNYMELTEQVVYLRSERIDRFLEQVFEFRERCEHDDNIDAVNSAWLAMKMNEYISIGGAL